MPRKVTEDRGVRTLLYDIETAPNLGYTWGKWQQDIIRFESEWYMLCFSYMWLGEDEPRVLALPDFKAIYKADPTSDLALVCKLHELFSEADIIVGHNSNNFDNRRANARFLYHGLTPPSPYKQVDTCLVAKKVFSFNSNRLGDLCQTLGLGGKYNHSGFDTWLGCMSGDKKSWAEMKEYNLQDVVLLHDLYLRLLPWMDKHPNIATIGNRPNACPKCGSEKGMIIRGHVHTAVSRRTKFQCKSCGGYATSRATERLATMYVS